MNVLNCLPKSAQPKAKQGLHAIWQAETQGDAHKAFDLFIDTYEAKYPKATLCLHKDRDELLAFYNFPAQHWQSIRKRVRPKGALQDVANQSLWAPTESNFIFLPTNHCSTIVVPFFDASQNQTAYQRANTEWFCEQSR